MEFTLPLWGARGSEFESRHPDQRNQRVSSHKELAFLLARPAGDAPARARGLGPLGPLGAPGPRVAWRFVGRPMQRAVLPAAAPQRDGWGLAEAEALLPSPLAGEGLGERGSSAMVSARPPLPNPSPARGEGLNTRRRGEIPGSGAARTRPTLGL